MASASNEKNHFTNREILDWFSVIKPIPKKEDYHPPSLPCSSAARQSIDALEKQEIDVIRHSLHQASNDVDRTTSYYYNDPRSTGLEIPGQENDKDFGYGLERPMSMPSRLQATMTTTAVFDQYNFDQNETPVLPILAYKEKIINTIETNKVTVIQGSTGSGKSTQVPQYILEKYASQRQHCNIVCTQPRRIAAMSVAKYVSESRGWRLGSLVGYQIAMDKITSDDTRLTFVTTGVLLMKLVNNQNMNEYTHVVLDEVHERDKDTDFCLLLVLRLLRTNSKNVKVILMSATLESQKFAKYFSETINNTTILPPIIDVEGHAYPVTEFFLDSFQALGQCDLPSFDNPALSDSAIKLSCNLIQHFDVLEKKLRSEHRGTVLVFLPGMPEIQRMEEALIFNCADLMLTVLPLHSSISREEQYRVFLKPDRFKRKVILATNIAESSITVPDIKYVIDFCLIKQLMCDHQTKLQSLKLCWASKASLTQRKGRAGRVSDGRCYRLIHESFYVNYIEEYSTPEIERCPIESIVLHTKQLDIGSPMAVLRWSITKPKLADIERAVLNLKEVGGLTLTVEGRVDPYDGDLTFMGHVLASLPVDIKVGKLLVLGHIFGCLEECVIIGAGLSVKPIFTKPYQDEFMKSYKSKMAWANFTFSDCLAILNAYKEWFSRKNSGQFYTEQLEKEWCQRNLINRAAIKELTELVRELSERLATFNIKPIKELVLSKLSNNDYLLLKLVIAGAFYPNYFYWSEIDEELAQREMSGHDPTTSVMLSSLPPNAEQYYSEISSLFEDCGKGKMLHFEQSRVYLEFERPRSSRSSSQSNNVLDAVYIALKKKHRRRPLAIHIVEGNKQEYISIDKRHMKNDSTIHKNDIPPAVIQKQKGYYPVLVTEIVDPGHVWLQYFNPSSQTNLRQLMEEILNTKFCPLIKTTPLDQIAGQYCLAMYSVDGLYYRGRVESVTEQLAQVIFVDYGNEECVPINFVCELPQHLRKLPKQAFECYLACIKPSYENGLEGQWSCEAKIRFQELVLGQQLFMSVYSEVEGLLRVDLWDTTDPKKDIHINKLLIEEGFALYYQETLSSKLAHDVMEKLSLVDAKPGAHSISVPWYDLEGKPSSLKPSSRGKRVVEWALKGPTNPCEVTFYAMTRSSGLRTAKVERDSVNSIVIDSEPQDKHKKLMVAAHIAVNSSGNIVLARNTTLLPNIHGLVHCLCLLFAPAVELRTDQLRRQYTGAICGLGFSPNTGTSLFPDHDMEIVFDTLFTQRDIDAINEIRHHMNIALSSEEEKGIIWGSEATMKIQNKMKTLLLKLVLEMRPDVTPMNSPVTGWNLISPKDIVPPQINEINDEGPPFYSMHSGINISGTLIQQSTERLVLLQRVKELRHKASRSLKHQQLFCCLCHVNLATPNELLLHLETRSHKLLERELEQELEGTVDATPPLTPTLWQTTFDN